MGIITDYHNAQGKIEVLKDIITRFRTALIQDAHLRQHNCPGCSGDECGAASAHEELLNVTIPALLAESSVYDDSACDGGS